MKHCFFVMAAAVPLLLPNCAQIRQTVNVEGHIFVKIPKISTKFEPRSVTIPLAEGPGRKGGATQETWFFKPVVQGPVYRQYTGEWYMASTADKKKSVVSRGLFTGKGWRRVRELTPEVATATYAAFGQWPTVIEPGQVFRSREYKPTLPLQPEQAPMRITKYPDKAWDVPKRDGKFDLTWHLNDDHSQLRRARQRVIAKTKSAGGSLTVAVLDTGYDGRLWQGRPRGLVDDTAERDTYRQLQYSEKSIVMKPGEYGEKHGTSTMSILAGGHVCIAPTGRHHGISEDLGGVPDAKVVPYRVAPWVVSPTTANLAMAIDRASRVDGADVISMSHGGAPTMMWMDAVNAAMDRGTVMVAATADYVNLPGFTAGLGTPSATVYPAACRRVLGVGGVTVNGKPYAKTDWSHFPYCLKGFVRASFGPDGSRWHWNKEHQMEPKNYDETQVKRLGKLHAFPINGYAPNVMSLLPAERNGTGANRAELHFGGASASTPQVAAAAALWIAYYEKEMRADGYWNSWQKPQMAYLALLAAAERDRSMAWPDLYMGSGNLKASDALDITPAQVRAINTDLLRWPRGDRPWPPHDIYSGDNGLKRIVKWGLPTFVDLNPPPDQHWKRMPLQPQTGGPPKSYEECLRTVYENQILSHHWLRGRPTLSDKGYKDVKPAFWKKPLQYLLRRGPVEEEKVREQARQRAAAGRAGR
jgi:hypothetical protein